MQRSSGIRLVKKVVTFQRWILRRRRGRRGGLQFQGFLRRLTLGFNPKGGRDAVPKGHLAIRVGETESVKCRFVVPVAYINHSLFRELLDRVESVYGYNNPGTINLPCSISEYEEVRRNIAAAESSGLDVLKPGKKRMFAMPYLRNSFSKILVDSIVVF